MTYFDVRKTGNKRTQRDCGQGGGELCKKSGGCAKMTANKTGPPMGNVVRSDGRKFLREVR